MPELRFVIKPDVTNALAPTLFRWVFRYSVAAVVVYTLFYWLVRLGVFDLSLSRILFALGVIVVMFSFSSIKLQFLVLQNTRYVFYDTHVVEERKLLVTRRHSMPYKQISKIINNSSLWDRFTKASNMVLRTARHDEGQDMVLRSIKNSEDVEHKIYRLLKEDARTRR